MDEKQRTKEKGLRVWRGWNNGNLRGYYNIGKQIQKEYGLTDKDIADMKRIRRNKYARLKRKIIKLEKEAP